MTPPPNKRHGVHDRDIYVEKHQTPPTGTPAFVEEEYTGRYERGEIDADELAEKRAEWSHEERFKKIETKQDQTATSLIRLETKVDTVVDLLKGKAAEDGKTTRTRMSTNAKVIIAIATAAIAAVATVLVAVLK